MNNSVEIYQTGNPWQKKVYAHMAAFLDTKGVTSFGESANGNQYRHLLSIKDEGLNFITNDIYNATQKRFDDHKAGDRNRIMTNTAASQPYCFNLIIYLQQHPELANKLFSQLLEKPVTVAHLEYEFTPYKDESVSNSRNSISGFEPTGDETIGDQQGKQGTDADIAVFYTFGAGKKGVLLIEFKFIEAEFSVCSSYKNKAHVRQTCDSSVFNKELVEEQKRDSRGLLCGYNKFYNWQLTAKSTVLDVHKIKNSAACPFRFGLNQLWRNFILAERVAAARNCNEFGFWVFSPKENDEYLWRGGKTEAQFRAILTEKGNEHFKKVDLETILESLHSIVQTKQDKDWLLALESKYKIKQ